MLTPKKLSATCYEATSRNYIADADLEQPVPIGQLASYWTPRPIKESPNNDSSNPREYSSVKAKLILIGGRGESPAIKHKQRVVVNEADER